MKLRAIAESTNKPMSQGAKYFESLISYLKDNKDKHLIEWQKLNKYFKKPVTKTWQTTKHIITDLIKKTTNEQELATDREMWSKLWSMDDYIANASLFAIDPSVAAQTDFSQFAAPKNVTREIMRQLGPGGYLNTYAGPTTVNSSQLRRNIQDHRRNTNRLRGSLNQLKPAGYKPFNPF